MEAIAAKSAIVVAVFFFTLVPLAQISDRFLRWKYSSMNNTWNAMLADCLDKHANTSTSSWLARQVVAMQGGKLCRERALALHEAGYVGVVGNVYKLPTLSSEQARFTFKPQLFERIAYSLAAIIFPLGLIAFHSPVALVAAGSVISLVLTEIVVCDIRARIIPYQFCIAFGVLALIWVLLARPDAIASSLMLSVAAYLTVMATEGIAVKLTSMSAIGAGDRRLIPFICLLTGAEGLLPGLIGLCIVAGAMAVYALAQGRSRRSYLPFAPALMAFAVTGALYPLSPIAGLLL